MPRTEAPTAEAAPAAIDVEEFEEVSCAPLLADRAVEAQSERASLRLEFKVLQRPCHRANLCWLTAGRAKHTNQIKRSRLTTQSCGPILYGNARFFRTRSKRPEWARCKKCFPPSDAPSGEAEGNGSGSGAASSSLDSSSSSSSSRRRSDRWLGKKGGFSQATHPSTPAFDCGTVCNLFWLPGHWIADQLASSRSSRRQLPDFSRLNASGGCREGDSGDPVVHFTKFLQKLPAHFPGRRAWPRK